MSGSPNSTCLGSACAGSNILGLSEVHELRRLTSLVERVFHVSVAYVAMLGSRDRVMSRIGSGEQYWRYLKTYSLGGILAAPVVVRDAKHGLPDSVEFGELRFVAAAPIRTFCGHRLGVLVIADQAPRPGFSEQDVHTLVDLAHVVSGIFELRMVASQAMESNLQLREAEERFRSVADAAPALIGCYGAGGGCIFVNRAWLEFTGRSIQEERGDGWCEGIDPDHREAVLESYWSAQQTRQPFTIDVPLRRHDGVFRRMHCQGEPRILEDLSSSGVILCLTDIGEWHDLDHEALPETQSLAALVQANSNPAIQPAEAGPSGCLVISIQSAQPGPSFSPQPPSGPDVSA